MRIVGVSVSAPYNGYLQQLQFLCAPISLNPSGAPMSLSLRTPLQSLPPPVLPTPLANSPPPPPISTVTKSPAVCADTLPLSLPQMINLPPAMVSLLQVSQFLDQ